ncbi:MAG: barstar family protein [Clostridia bacterium]|nr:barstar family protein [Clostridia bacterium]
MAEIILDLREAASAAQVHSCLMNTFQFPFYYGRNLDALYDELTSWSGNEILLMLPSKPTGGMVDYLPRLLQVFEDAAQENALLKYRIEK